MGFVGYWEDFVFFYFFRFWISYLISVRILDIFVCRGLVWLGGGGGKFLFGLQISLCFFQFIVGQWGFRVFVRFFRVVFRDFEGVGLRGSWFGRGVWVRGVCRFGGFCFFFIFSREFGYLWSQVGIIGVVRSSFLDRFCFQLSIQEGRVGQVKKGI